MQETNKAKLISNYIVDNYNPETPILISDLYKVFPKISPNTIRSILKRLIESEDMCRVDKGIYALPNSKSVLGLPTVSISSVLLAKYLENSNGDVIGYKSGINFSNSLGLTFQMARIETIISNNVAKKRRYSNVMNRKIILDAPRVKITTQNYKLLQVLDLLTHYEDYSEYDLKDAVKPITSYLSSVTLEINEIESIVEKYPLNTQVKFYRIGGTNVIAQKSK